MRTFADTLRSLREERRLTQRELAIKLGLSYSAIAMYESGAREPNAEKKEEIADFFNVDMNYLYGKTPIRNSYRDLDKDVSIGVKIPVLGRVQAGIPIEAIEEILDYEEISQECASNGSYFALKIKGESMMPKIDDGDIVIVRKQSTVNNGEIAIVIVNGSDATCKKVHIRENGIMLVSLNPVFEPIFYASEDVKKLPVSIIGKVIELRAKF